MIIMDKEKIKDLYKQLIIEIGDDPNREGLKNTPERMSNMCVEIFRGYNEKDKPNITC
jgi:GTP cyclohydrolase I